MRGPTGTVLLRYALTAALLVVAGCSDEPDEPGTLPSSRQSPSATSTSASPATPEEEVEAAVRAYYAELTRAAQTNDVSALKELMTKGCPCYRAVRVISENERQGETTPDAHFRLTSLRVHDLEGDTALAEVRTQDPAYEVIDEGGEVVDRVSSQETHLDLSLVRVEDGRWIIGNWFNLDA